MRRDQTKETESMPSSKEQAQESKWAQVSREKAQKPRIRTAVGVPEIVRARSMDTDAHDQSRVFGSRTKV